MWQKVLAKVLEVVPDPAQEVVPDPAQEVVPDPAQEVVPEPAQEVVPESVSGEPVPEPAAVSPSLKKWSTRRRQKPLMPSQELAQRKPTKLISTKGDFCMCTRSEPASLNAASTAHC